MSIDPIPAPKALADAVERLSDAITRAKAIESTQDANALADDLEWKR